MPAGFNEIIANISLPTSAALIEALPVIVSLIIIEGLLSVDNALAIAAMANHLPGRQKYLALKFGIIGAYFFRGLCRIHPRLRIAQRSALRHSNPAWPRACDDMAEIHRNRADYWCLDFLHEERSRPGCHASAPSFHPNSHERPCLTGRFCFEDFVFSVP